MRRAVAVVGVGVVLFAAGPAAARQALPAACPPGSVELAVCSVVSVPLDRSGVVAGTVRLQVQAASNAAANADRVQIGLPAIPTRGTMVLLAGGPGQGSASAFNLAGAFELDARQQQLPGYDLVAFDGRGMGRSGAIDCPGLQRASQAPLAVQRRQAAACARQLGRGASLYSTAAHAADIDAVRQALGVDRISLFAVSYGTELALNYARAYPQHVDRLILDSVLPAEGADPFVTDTLRAIPSKLAAWCAGRRCAGATHDFAGDVVRVANAADRRPLRATLRLASGKRAVKRVDGTDVVAAVVDLDLSEGVAAQAPAAFAAARQGHPAALVRLVDTDQRAQNVLPLDAVSFGLFAATECADGPFPWAPQTPPGRARAAAIKRALGRFTRADLGGFGTYATQLGNAHLCEVWPGPSGGVLPLPGAYPDVPVLAISGGIDMRTPTANARAVLAHFPRGRLLIAPGLGHSPTSNIDVKCLSIGVHAFLDDRPAPRATCPRPAPILRPIPSYPAAPRARLNRAATRRLAIRTVQDAGTIGAVASSASAGFTIGGLAGGTLTLTKTGGYRLRDYAIVTGVSVTGTISPDGKRPGGFTGRITVRGRLATTHRIKLPGTT